jgi:hypothetical protein
MTAHSLPARLRAAWAVLLFGALAAPWTAAQAQGGSPSTSPPAEGKGLVGNVHTGISYGVTGTAEWLDSFFITDRVEQEVNRTHLLLRTDSLWRENQRFKQKVDGRLRVVLPALRDRLQLVVTGDEDTRFDETTDGAAPAAPEEETDGTADDDSQGVTELALQYFAKLTRRRNLRFDAGGRLDGVTPVLFTGARYRYLFFEAEPWASRFIQNLRWYTDDGWESRSRLELDRDFGDNTLGRFQVTGDWYQDRDGFFYGFGPVVFQSLSERRVLRYEALSSWVTEPEDRLEEVQLRVRYRQRIWRDWVYIELAPEVTFPRGEDFDATPGFLLRFDAYFSERHT